MPTTATFDSNWKVVGDSALALSSEQNGSTNASSRHQPQTGSESRLGFEHGFRTGLGWGLGRDIVNLCIKLLQHKTYYVQLIEEGLEV